jgi:hypothetical protein
VGQAERSMYIWKNEAILSWVGRGPWDLLMCPNLGLGSFFVFASFVSRLRVLRWRLAIGFMGAQRFYLHSVIGIPYGAGAEDGVCREGVEGMGYIKNVGP